MAYAAASALYSYFWWDSGSTRHSTGNVNLDAGSKAVSLMHLSIQHRSCDDFSLGADEFLGRQCPARWRQLMLLSAEMARILAVDARDVRSAAHFSREATKHFQTVKELSFFKQFVWLGSQLNQPHDMSFNMDYYPHVSAGPVWPKHVIPLTAFLEEHFHRQLLALA